MRNSSGDTRDFRAVALIRDLQTAIRWADSENPLDEPSRRIVEGSAKSTLHNMVGEMWDHIQTSITEYNEV